MIKISFLGDISLNNCYNRFYRDGINPFVNIGKLLEGSDFNIGNLECLAEGENGENELKYPRLSTKSGTLNLLKYLNLKVVTLAHNHVYDNLLSGFQNTIEFLRAQRIQFMGAGLSGPEAEREIIISEKGVKIGLLNYVTQDTNPKLPKNSRVYLNNFDIVKIEKKIRLLKKAVDHVVILVHWGGSVEEGFYPDFGQPVLARRMINSGADLIVGGHSHTIQPFEIYRGKHIFYSLGNFCFDDIKHDHETFQIGRFRKRKTIIPTISFTKSCYSVEVTHAVNLGGHILRAKYLSEIRLAWRNQLFKLTKRYKIIWNIYFWHLKKIVPITNYFIEANEGIVHQVLALDTKRVVRYLKKGL